MLANKVIVSARDVPAVPRPGIAEGPKRQGAWKRQGGWKRQSAWKRLGGWLGRALHNHTTRHYLAEMDDRMLADVGLSRAQAQAEASRWMWD